VTEAHAASDSPLIGAAHTGEPPIEEEAPRQITEALGAANHTPKIHLSAKLEAGNQRNDPPFRRRDEDASNGAIVSTVYEIY
jgi:hypothetical protein